MAMYLLCLTVLGVVGMSFSVKPGCPTPDPNLRCIWYNDQCKNDDANCPKGQICCGDNCGTACTKPVVATKPGMCPPLPPDTVGACAEFCTGDASCPGNQKCCSNGCGHDCRTPTGGVKPPKPQKLCKFGKPLPGIFCGRGPSRQDCPKGYFCNISPVDAYAVCCRTSYKG